MWDKIKNDSLLKTIAVILLGVLAFGFAFNIMFGSGNSSMEEGSMMSSGYSLSNSLEYIIRLLIQLVIISFLLGVIVWIFRTVTKHSENSKSNQLEWLKEDPIIRNTLIIAGIVVVALFGFSFLRRFTASGTGAEMSTGYNTMSNSFQGVTLIAFLLKVLIFAFIIILGYAMFVFVKENNNITSGTKDRVTSSTASKVCTVCKEKLNDDWKACPFCGSDTASDNKTEKE